MLYTLFALATVQATRSIFLVNISLLDLPAYERGVERNPFQSRVALIPLLRFAYSNAALSQLSAFFEASLMKVPYRNGPPEHMSPEKMLCVLLGLASMLGAIAFLIAWGRRRCGTVWWIPPALLLVVLYTTYAARYEVQFWYPYDRPHFLLFGVAAALILQGRFAAAFAVFLVDLPVRETSIYLIPVLLTSGWSRSRLRSAAIWAGAMAAVWLPFTLLVARRFAHNASDTGISPCSMMRSLGNPLHWPQVAAAFGFMLVPFLLGWKDLSRHSRAFVLGMLPCLLVTLLFGVWYETRIWDEWMIPASMLLTEQAIPMLRRSLPKQPAQDTENIALVHPTGHDLYGNPR